MALIVESGEPREVMHFALLLGYGASAVNPYLAIETLEDLYKDGHFPTESSWDKVFKSYMKATDKGLLKTFSKMGISTLQSYQGAQIFEAIGLNRSLVERYFTGTASRIEGVSIEVLAREVADEARVRHAIPERIRHRAAGRRRIPVSRARRAAPAESADGEQAAARRAAIEAGEFPGICENRGPAEPRFADAARACSISSPPARRFRSTMSNPPSEIVKRFATGAMSFGSISKEAHETLAIAMNRIGGKSNTGEGGEDEARFKPDAERRPAPQRDQAGGIGPLRRDRELPGECGRSADQDFAGRKAR